MANTGGVALIFNNDAEHALTTMITVQMAEQVDTNKYAITIENGAKISHVAIFLLPNVDLDAQFQALIYFQLPNQDFKLFGSISQMKPSAIFKLNNSGSNSSQILDDIDMDGDSGKIFDPLDNITVGISIEPVIEAERQLRELKESQLANPNNTQLAVVHQPGIPSDPTTTALLAGKIVKHAYNYLTEFIDDEGKVSIKFFDSWWDKFKTRLQNDPKFLESQE